MMQMISKIRKDFLEKSNNVDGMKKKNSRSEINNYKLRDEEKK